MPNYEELYFKLFRETEEAIRILVSAQQACEELFLAMGDGEEVAPKEDN